MARWTKLQALEGVAQGRDDARDILDTINVLESELKLERAAALREVHKKVLDLSWIPLNYRHDVNRAIPIPSADASALDKLLAEARLEEHDIMCDACDKGLDAEVPVDERCSHGRTLYFA